MHHVIKASLSICQVKFKKLELLPSLSFRYLNGSPLLLCLSLWRPWSKTTMKGLIVFLWVSVQVRYHLSHFRPPSSACCCCAKYNPSEKAIQVSLPCVLCRPLKGGQSILILTLAAAYHWEWAWPGVPTCWFKLHTSNLTPHLVTGWGIWQWCI